jgi:hypothetical protein
MCNLFCGVKLAGSGVDGKEVLGLEAEGVIK